MLLNYYQFFHSISFYPVPYPCDLEEPIQHEYNSEPFINLFTKQIMMQTSPSNIPRPTLPPQLNPSRITTPQPPLHNHPLSLAHPPLDSSPHQRPPQLQPSGPVPHRHTHKKSYLNPSFIGAIVAILALSLAFVYQYLMVSKPVFWIAALVIFLILLIMTKWSYFSTVCTHPGRVPFYYGMSPEISQHKQVPRKYCIMCHNFKPQRTHHCSSCRTCVLNMDHHCPWVNNCVGFWNRKYFILFLLYISAGLVLMSIVQIIVLVDVIKNAIATKITDIHFALKIIIALITFPLTFMLIAFTIFHVKMVLNNTTTLEGLMRKKAKQQFPGQRDVEFQQEYDIGQYENFIQVFGERAMYWPIPVFGNGPKGNGTSFPKSPPKEFDAYNNVGYQQYRTRQEFESRPLTNGGLGNTEKVSGMHRILH